MKVVFHPLFIIMVVIALCTGLGLFVFSAILAVLIHETCHAVAANCFGIKMRKLTLLPFGAQVNIDCTFLPRRKQILILLAGSFGNIFTALLTSGFLWMFPSLFIYFEYFIIANVIPAALNLLPLYPLDGGKILKTPKYISNIVFCILFFAGCFVWFHWAIIGLSVFMLLTVNMEPQTNEFASRFYKTVGHQNGVICEVAVSADMSLFQVYKLVSAKNFTKFIVTDMKNKFFFENDLETWLTAQSIDTKLMHILK